MVAIKNMKMPNNCEDCALCQKTHGYDSETNETLMTVAWCVPMDEFIYNGKADNCSLALS